MCVSVVERLMYNGKCGLNVSLFGFHPQLCFAHLNPNHSLRTRPLTGGKGAFYLV